MSYYAVLTKLVRQSLTAAIPGGYFSQVVYDALDIAAIPASQRVAFITFELGEPRLRSFGKKTISLVGTGIIRMYEPTDKGDGDQIKNADAILTALRFQKQVEDRVQLSFGIPALSNIDRTGSHWERVVRAPFEVITE